MKLYVGNLAYSVGETELRDMFTAFGEIGTVELIKDRMSGQSKGFGFVEMPNNSEADVAIKALNGKMSGGRPLKVNQAQDKPNDRSKHRRRF